MDDKNSVLNFDLSPKQIKYKDILSKEFIELEIWAISDINPNRNNSHFTVESLKKAISNVKNKPIVGFFENNDFTTHEGKLDYDYELDNPFWNTEKGERILGWVRESDPVEVVKKDDLHWLKFRCILCTTYCYRQVKRLLKDKHKKVSVEITVNKHEVINGIEEIYEFTLNGVTILGSKNGKAVLEGIPDAHLSVLGGLDEDAMMEQKRVLSFVYRQFEANTNTDVKDKVVEDSFNLDEENTKKEVNQADMEQEELEGCENYGYTIKVDKSKESMSDRPWGEVDKTELRRKVVEADNFKSIADDIFLDLREGWEEGEVSKLKYPVMEINSNVAVYNRGGLASAKAYAEQHNDEKVLSKLKKIYEDLDLVDSDEEKEKACKYCEDCKEDYCDDCGCEDPEGESEDKDEKACSYETHEEVVEIEEITPDVAVIVNEDGVLNEPETELSMEESPEEMDFGIPQCEEAPENLDPAPAEGIENGEAVPEPVTEECGPVDDEGCAQEEEVTEKESTELEDLRVRCEALEIMLKDKEAKLVEYEEKLNGYCDYEEIKHKLSEAETKLEKHRCEELKTFAANLMAGEVIKSELYSEIISKCCDGAYGCEDDIKKDVAIAVYTSRPNQEKRFSVSITDPETNEIKTKKDIKLLSSAERVKVFLNK